MCVSCPLPIRVRPGISFRVGVHPPLDESKLSTPPLAKASQQATASGGTGIDVNAMEKQMLNRETKAAVLRIEIFKVGGQGREAMLLILSEGF